jgi:3',5'-cyclic AMP phosphodiesterase CpdA
MSLNPLRIAVASDLHFVSAENVNDGDYHSWLSFLADKSFANLFWKNLLEKINTDKIKADILVCPGDITTHAEAKALKFAWEKLLELAEALDCKILATATGNHDVKSRPSKLDNVIRDLDQNDNLLENLKLLEPPYPLVDLKDTTQAHSNRIHYFGADYLLYETDKYRILILNSCSSHSADPKEYERGSVSESTMNWIKRDLQKINERKKLGILICHHHPIQHSEHNLGSYDFMRGGTELLDMLNSNGRWIVIHGHKHHAKLNYYSSGSKKAVVFAAGTLSAHKQTLGNDFTNQFYILNVDVDIDRGTPVGNVDVYSWQGSKWANSRRTCDGIYTGIGFGDPGCLETIAENISQLVKGPVSVPWNDIVEKMPKLRECVPQDISHIKEYLLEFNIDMNFTPETEILSLERSKD